MITLGITGRSGCGKSTVTAVFAAHGVPLADADQLSREILLPGSPLLPQLAARFGGDILKPDGTLDRRLLADRAFATPEGKAALDSLTHPAIVARIRAAKQAAQAAGAPLFVLDGAVIVGTAAEAECDRLAVVTSAALRGKNCIAANSSAAAGWCCGWLRCVWQWCLRCAWCRLCATGQSSFCTPASTSSWWKNGQQPTSWIRF